MVVEQAVAVRCTATQRDESVVVLTVERSVDGRVARGEYVDVGVFYTEHSSSWVRLPQTMQRLSRTIVLSFVGYLFGVGKLAPHWSQKLL